MAVKTLEQGSIYFFYRPKKGEEEPDRVEEIQRFYIVLQPPRPTRLIVIGRKLLPEVERRRDRFWGFVDMVRDNPEEIEDELDPKPSGQQAARPAGEGVYQLISHDRRHTHLVYSLELPQQPGEVQKELRIKDEASYILSVKNPKQPSPPGLGLEPEREADYPPEIRQRFGNRRFLPAEPDLLNYEGTELIFIGAAEDIEQELGIEVPVEHESPETAEIFRDLKLEKDRHPVEPLLKGRWK